ncbi:MAG TPA: SMI1/KNR4 family protein [Gallionellaceae bacterium]
MDTLQRYLKAYEGVIRGPVDAEVVDAILSRHGVANRSYRDWLLASGGGPIGPDWYDGVEELPQSQEKLKNEKWNVAGFVIAWDGAGNPIVLGTAGEILTEDHNFGGVHQLAEGFDDLLAANIS